MDRKYEYEYIYMNLKNKIIIVSLLFVIFVSVIFGKEEEESFTNIIGNGSGFFSQFFFTVNHYIYCKKNKKNFKINSDGWTYKYELGWEDYFVPTVLHFTDVEDNEYSTSGTVMQDFTIQEYADNIPEIFIYNEKTKNEILNYKNKICKNNTCLFTSDTEYDYIYIRRGDKSSEYPLVDEIRYIELLLEKNPNTKNIFLQTDDYSSYIKLEKYIEDKHLNISLYSNSTEKNKGAVEHDIQNMNKSEIYEHTIDLLSGIEISKYSKTCIVDYSSNVARFMKLVHTHPENVFDVNGAIVDYNKYICPSHWF